MSDDRIEAACLAFVGIEAWGENESMGYIKVVRSSMRAALEAADATEASAAQGLADDVASALTTQDGLAWFVLQDALDDWRKATGQAK